MPAKPLVSGQIVAAFNPAPTRARYALGMFSRAPYRGLANALRTSAIPMQLKLRLATLRATAFGDTANVAFTYAIANAMRIVNSMILTRLLTAGDFGIVGVVTSIAVTFAMVSDIGVAAFIIRHDSEDPRFLDEVWTLRLIRCTALTVAVALLSGPIADLIGKPELQLPIAIGGLSFLNDGLSSLAFATAARQRRVKLLNKLNLVGQLVGMVATIALALAWRSYWAIIVGNLISQATINLLGYINFEGSVRRWRFSRERMVELFRFSRYITFSTILSLILGQTDKLALSRVMTLSMFGLYTIGSNLAQMPLVVAAAYVQQILFPRYAERRRQAPGELAASFYSERRKVSLLFMVAAAAFVAMLPLAVAILYDHRYTDVAFYGQLLGISTIFILNTSAINEYMIAAGRPQYTFNANLVRIAFLLVGGTGFYLWLGAIGVVLTVGLLEVAAQVYAWIELKRQGVLSVREEGLLMGAGAAGFAIGFVANHVGLMAATWLHLVHR